MILDPKNKQFSSSIFKLILWRALYCTLGGFAPKVLFFKEFRCNIRTLGTELTLGAKPPWAQYLYVNMFIYPFLDFLFTANY